MSLQNILVPNNYNLQCASLTTNSINLSTKGYLNTFLICEFDQNILANAQTRINFSAPTQGTLSGMNRNNINNTYFEFMDPSNQKGYYIFTFVLKQYTDGSNNMESLVFMTNEFNNNEIYVSPANLTYQFGNFPNVVLTFPFYFDNNVSTNRIQFNVKVPQACSVQGYLFVQKIIGEI